MARGRLSERLRRIEEKANKKDGMDQICFFIHDENDMYKYHDELLTCDQLSERLDADDDEGYFSIIF